MTEIEEKALALVSEVLAERELPIKAQMRPLSVSIDEALCRAIEQHEAYKREVSDAVKSYLSGSRSSCILDRFILPKPDPLVEVIEECEDGTYGETKAEYAAKLREALAKRGLKIVEDV